MSGDAPDDAEVYHCPDCGAELDVLYKRNEFDPTLVTGWCPESGVAKAVPVKEETDA